MLRTRPLAGGLIARQLAVAMLVSRSAYATQLLWTDQADLGYHQGSANAITVAAGRVVAAGSLYRYHQLLAVRAYEAASGSVVWQDTFSLAGIRGAEARALAVQGERVFVAGFVTQATSSARNSYNTDLLLRALDARSGKVAWQNSLDRARGPDEALAIALGDGLVFAAGYMWDPGTNEDFAVAAFESNTGRLVWRDLFDRAQGSDRARALAAADGRVFAAGFSQVAAQPTAADAALVRALDAATGRLLWQDQFDLPGAFRAVAVAGSVVIAVGSVQSSRGDFDWLVRAYDVATGGIVWQDVFDRAGLRDFASGIAFMNGRVFVVGRSERIANDGDFLVRAYDARTGTMLWQNRFDRGTNDWALAVAADQRQVFAVGSAGGISRDDFTVHDLVLRAYDAATGKLLWQDVSDLPGNSEATAVAAAEGGVFVAGSVSAPCTDFLVHAYRRP